MLQPTPAFSTLSDNDTLDLDLKFSIRKSTQFRTPQLLNTDDTCGCTVSCDTCGCTVSCDTCDCTVGCDTAGCTD